MVSYESVMFQAGVVVKYAMFFLVPAIFYFVLITLIRHRVIIVEFHKRNDSRKIKVRLCRKVIDKHEQITYWKPIFKKEMIKPPDNYDVVSLWKMWDVVMIYRPNERNYQYLLHSYENQKSEINILPEDLNFWHVLERKKSLEKYKKQSFLEKYGAIIVSLGMLGITLVVIILILQRVDAAIALGNTVVAESHKLLRPTIAGEGLILLFNKRWLERLI